jgi:cell division protein ZapB
MRSQRLTHHRLPTILMPMSEKETAEHGELDLRKLEQQVEELIRACSYLKDENKSLRARQDSLVAERAALIEKTELARTRVEAMITRLKFMESAQ